MDRFRLSIYTLILFICLVGNLISIGTEEESEFSSHKISMGMIVNDLDKSIDFYTNVIGMEIVGEFDIDTTFGRNSGLTDGKAFNVKQLKLIDEENAPELKLMTFEKKPDRKSMTYIHDDFGIQYLTIFVKSISPFLARIKKQGVELLGNTPVELQGGNQFILIQDPDGTFIELIGPK